MSWLQAVRGAEHQARAEAERTVLRDVPRHVIKPILQCRVAEF